jgi:hypothetical protein
VDSIRPDNLWAILRTWSYHDNFHYLANNLAQIREILKAPGDFRVPSDVYVNDELEALQNAMDNARSGDLIIMFYEKFAPAFQLVQKYMDVVQPISILQDKPAFMPAVGSAIQ